MTDDAPQPMLSAHTVIFYDHTLMGTGLGRYRTCTVMAHDRDHAKEVFEEMHPHETAAFNDQQYRVDAVVFGDYALVKRRKGGQ